MAGEAKVYESGAGKWIQIHEGAVRYTSDSYSATAFDLVGLSAAHQWFEDFLIYRETLFAVPAGSNRRPWECDSVTKYIKEALARGGK